MLCSTLSCLYPSAAHTMETLEASHSFHNPCVRRLDERMNLDETGGGKQSDACCQPRNNPRTETKQKSIPPRNASPVRSQVLLRKSRLSLRTDPLLQGQPVARQPLTIQCLSCAPPGAAGFERARHATQLERRIGQHAPLTKQDG